jgi:hypothetical protein
MNSVSDQVNMQVVRQTFERLGLATAEQRYRFDDGSNRPAQVPFNVTVSDNSAVRRG